jgi:transposase InsO family protein
LRHPNQTPAETEAALLALRQAHMRWGPRKLREVLRRSQARVPAASTIGALLQRAGLVGERRRRRRTPPYSQPLAAAEGPNQVWCADFKGHFRTRDGERIDPFTMSDAHSRYLLRCQAVPKTDTSSVRAICEAAFREYGLPQAIRTDNGAPFASRAVAGLSRLAVYWMKLNIVPERIAPGHPEQNGRHERMHRTLKQETAQPAAANRRAQQRAFDEFRREYNQQRPHEALGLRTPAEMYDASPRPYPSRIAQPEYEPGVAVRGVCDGGKFRWQGRFVFLSHALAGERVALRPVADDGWCIYFAAFPLAYFDSRKFQLRTWRSCREKEAAHA